MGNSLQSMALSAAALSRTTRVKNVPVSMMTTDCEVSFAAAAEGSAAGFGGAARAMGGGGGRRPNAPRGGRGGGGGPLPNAPRGGRGGGGADPAFTQVPSAVRAHRVSGSPLRMMFSPFLIALVSIVEANVS